MIVDIMSTMIRTTVGNERMRRKRMEERTSDTNFALMLEDMTWT